LFFKCFSLEAQHKVFLDMSYTSLFNSYNAFYPYKTVFSPFGLCIEPSYALSDKLFIASGININYRRKNHENDPISKIESNEPLLPIQGYIIENIFYTGIPLYLRYRVLSHSDLSLYLKFGINNNLVWTSRKFRYFDQAGHPDELNHFVVYSADPFLGLDLSYLVSEKISLFFNSYFAYNFFGWDKYDIGLYSIFLYSVSTKLGIRIPIK
jgi:hypothetical protein